MKDNIERSIITQQAFPTKKGEEIQLCISEYKGRKYLDMRIWFLSKQTNSLRPTKKGINFSADKLQDLQSALWKLSQVVKNSEPKAKFKGGFNG